MLNFKANYISPVFIQKKSDKGYKPCEASFVEFDMENKNDKNVMGKIVQEWGYNTYAYPIFRNMPYYDEDINPQNHFYAVTTQKTNFDKLDSERVLGVIELDEQSNKDVKIEYIQTDPAQLNGSCFKQYKNIGKASIDCIKSIYSDRLIKLYSVPSAQEFYENNGFKSNPMEKDKSHLVWQK